MRRSERASRKPDFLTFPDQGRARPATIDEESESDAESEESDIPQPLDTVKKSQKAPAPSHVTTAISGGKRKRTKIVATGKLDMTLEDNQVVEVLALLKRDRIAGVSKLVNICLQAAGCGESWIAEDVDLEPLGPEEIDQLLEERIHEWASTAETKSYPLIERAKGRSDPFLVQFRAFWQKVTDELSTPDGASKRSSSTLRVLLEVLVSFSSIAVASIRDAVSTALLAIASSLIAQALKLKSALQMLERQTQSTSSKSRGDDEKARAVAKQQADTKKAMQELVSQIEALFSSVYMHRSRDSNDDVRLHCVQTLRDFVRFDPDPSQPLRSERLKYLGWACNDASHAVRKAAVDTIAELVAQDDLAEHLTAFASHFVPRFIQIAAKDVSEDVSLAMLQGLRVMQRQGFLDAVSEEALDEVDVILFDEAVSVELRTEALRFLLDHTEGFDEDDKLEEETQQQQRGKPKKGQGKIDAPKRHIALQLETLTEFAEHHLGSQSSWAALLAEALLHSEKAHLLRDWPTLCALLLRESDAALVSHALRPAQIGALLTMFVFSAKRTHAAAQQPQTASNKSTKQTPQQLQAQQDFAALNELLLRHLPALLRRFQDDSQHLALLSDLLRLLDLQSASHFHTFRAQLQELFSHFDSDVLLRNIILALKHLRTKPLLQEHVHKLLVTLASQAREQSQKAARKLKQIAGKVPQSNSSSKASSKLLSGLRVEAKELALELRGALKRLRVLCELISVRDLVAKGDEEDVTADFAEETMQTLEYLSELCGAEEAQDEAKGDDGALEEVAATKLTIETEVGSAFGDALNVLLQEVLWRFKAIVDDLRAGQSQHHAQKEAEMEEEKGEAETLAEIQVQGLLRRRETLVFFCLESLRQQLPRSSELARRLKLESFQLISALRSFFPTHTQRLKVLDALALHPSDDLLQLLRGVFEQEEGRLLRELDHQDDRDQAEGHNDQTASVENRQAAQQMAQKLLLPLSRSLLVDPQHLNRRQAAVVLRYLDDGHAELADVAKHFAKRLKETCGIARFAEVQLAALKLVFHEKCLAIANARDLAEQNEDADFDFALCDAKEAAGYAQLAALSRKFATVLAVGKAKGSVLACLLALLKAGVDFSSQRVEHVGFCAALSGYLRLLQETDVQQLREYLLEQLGQQEQLARRLEDERAAPTIAVSQCFELLDALQLKTTAGNTSQSTLRRRVTQKTSRASKGATKARSKKRSSREETEMDIDLVEEDLDEELMEELAALRNSTSSSKSTKSSQHQPSKAPKWSKQQPQRKEAELSQDVVRRSGRSLSQRSMNYEENEEEDDIVEDDFDHDLEAGISQRHSSSSAGGSGGRKRGGRSSSPPALNMDVEDIDDEYEEEEQRDEAEEMRRKKLRTSSQSSAKARLSHRSGRSVAAAISEDEDNIDALPSRRKYLS